MLFDVFISLDSLIICIQVGRYIEIVNELNMAIIEVEMMLGVYAVSK